MARFDSSKHPRDSRGRFKRKSSPVVAIAVAASLGYGLATDVGGLRTAVSPARSRDSEVHIETDWSPRSGSSVAVNLDYRVSAVIRKSEGPSKSRVSVTLDITNHSSFPIPIDNSDQQLRTQSGDQYSAEGATIEIAPSRRAPVTLVFAIGASDRPNTITVVIAGKRTKVEIT
jgi:hypothetical protein